MRALALTALLLIPGGIAEDRPTTGGTPSGTFAVRCRTLHVGNGDVLNDATMIVVDGRIQAIGAGASAPDVPDDMPVLDVGDKIVMPGIVVADTDLSGHGDASHNVTPDFLALDGFDFVRKHARTLSGGVTTVYLSPGRNRLISGRGSVVKMHGDDLVQRVLNEAACLRVNMGAAATRAPALFEPTPAPTSDDPLLPARRQYPSARISILPVLREIFGEARQAQGTNGNAIDASYQGEGSYEDHYAVAPLLAAQRGDLPLRIAVVEAADVRRALFFAGEMGSSMVLENPYEIAAVAADAAERGVAAVFRVPVRPGASNPGGEDRNNKAPLNRPENAARAAAAGMRVALAPSSTRDLADMLLVAGIAIRHGLTPAQAMRALTSDAAVVLGVGDRVGTLEAGRDADFLVLSGEPFAIGTLVEKTFVDGVPAYERQETTNVLAIRAGEIWTMAGVNITDGMIVVQDGVIKAVGPDRGVPYGARVLDLGDDSVVVPGFIDSYSHLGLSGRGSGIPSGAADQRIADVVTYDDPLFREALEAGMTTVLVSGTDSGPVSGRVAALKTGAADRDAMVVKETAAIRFVHDAIGPDNIKALASQIDRGKKYLDAWKKYEKALADFEAGVGEKPVEAAPATEEAVKEDPITGLWEVELIESPIPVEISITLALELEGTTVKGSATMDMRGQSRDSEIQNGVFEDGTFTCTVGLMGDSTLTAKVTTDAMEGTISGGPMEIKFKGTRVAKEAPKAAAPSTAKNGDKGPEAPKKPKFDEALEPLRALLEKRIPAVVRCNRAPAVESVIKYFEDNKLPYVLTGVKDAIETPDILGSTKPPVVLGPDVIKRKGQTTTNAAAVLSDRGHPVALGTGNTAGARYLPVHAALAVRYGMDPTEALKAMTVHAARMFKIDDRVGSLERGKDADLVVFSGSPFEMTSRVRLVVVDGKVVVDNREANKR